MGSVQEELDLGLEIPEWQCVNDECDGIHHYFVKRS